MIDADDVREYFDGLKDLESILKDLESIPYAHGRAILLMADAGLLKPESYSDEKARTLIEREADDPDANDALRLVVLRFIWAGKPVPRGLSSFVEKALVSRKPRIGRPPAKYFRNLMFVHTVQRVCEENGLRATRSAGEKDDADAAASDKISACSFVASALGVSEKTVAEAWEDRDRLRLKVPQPPKRRKFRPA